MISPAVTAPSWVSGFWAMADMILLSSHSGVVTVTIQRLKTDAPVVDGNDILNNIGIFCPLRNLI
jgi:hypothetical protein